MDLPLLSRGGTRAEKDESKRVRAGRREDGCPAAAVQVSAVQGLREQRVPASDESAAGWRATSCHPCLQGPVCNLFSCRVGGRWPRLHKLYLTDNYTKTNCARPYPSPSVATSRRCVRWSGGGGGMGAGGVGEREGAAEPGWPITHPQLGGQWSREGLRRALAEAHRLLWTVSWLSQALTNAGTVRAPPAPRPKPVLYERPQARPPGAARPPHKVLCCAP